jgi:acyl-CoA thioesterase FadM
MPRADFVCAPRLRVRCCRVANLGRSSMTFHFEIYRDAEEAPLVTAEWCM